MPGFGRRYAPDDRDQNFLMRRMLTDARSVALPPRKTWSISSTALNQGNTGTCVGHAWRNFLRCAPIRTERGGPSAFDVYRSAVLKDPWRDNDDEAQLPDGDRGMDTGTTIRAGAEAVTGFGRLKSYVWAFALQPAVEWVLTTGPVVLGTNWYSSLHNRTPRALYGSPPTPGWSAVMRISGGVDTRRALAPARIRGATTGVSPETSSSVP
jgi:hypothetical protein